MQPFPQLLCVPPPPHLQHDVPLVPQLAQLSTEGDVAPWGRIMGGRRAVFFTRSHCRDHVWRYKVRLAVAMTFSPEVGG